MEQSRLKYLFEKHFAKTGTPDERAEFADLIAIDANREELMELLAGTWEKFEGEGIIIPTEKTEEMLTNILYAPLPSALGTPVSVGESGSKVRKLPVWLRLTAAAAVLFAVVQGYRYLAFHSQTPSTQVAQARSQDVKPGGFRASLVLSDGRRITLDSAGPGKLADQGNTAVMSKGGQVVYQAGKADTGALMYNTMTTAKGETYALTLPDGSRVWLNSASSIRFPVAFPGKERRIQVTGEVYVEVAKNPAKSFIAETRGVEIQALGTEFNINSYPDEEKINTTLINGAVKVASGAEHKLLKPGQQTGLDSKGQLSEPKEVDIEEITSWKDGNFQFESADMTAILRQLARWYDVEVIYDGPVKEKKFFGIISRNSPLSNVLEMLKTSDIQFRIEGKKLYVRSV